MLELTTYIELELAHRLGGAYSGRCLSLHGHRYEVEVTVASKGGKLNADGMIVDFKRLKESVKAVLDENWDHASCFNKDDPIGIAAKAAGSERVHLIDGNPTLEWMVEAWAGLLQARFDQESLGIVLVKLKASETARNTVTWTRTVNAEKTIRGILKKDMDARNTTSEDNAELSSPVDAEKPRDAAYRRRLEAALRPTPKHDWASPGATVKVDTLAPMDEIADEQEETNPDASLYFIQFRVGWVPYSTTVRTAFTGKSLVDRCMRAAQAFANRILDGSPANREANREENTAVILLGITKLPG